MMTLSPAKEIRGTIVCPPNPDFFFLSIVIALTQRSVVRISPVEQTPLIQSIIDTFAHQCSCERDGQTVSVTPGADLTAPVALNNGYLPCEEFVLFLLLGTGRRVQFDRWTQAQIDRWTRLASWMGCTINNNNGELTLKENCFLVPDTNIDENDLHAAIGLTCGLNRTVMIRAEFAVQSPLRHILPTFGYSFLVKLENPNRINDPLARRMRLLVPGKRKDCETFFSLCINAACPDPSDPISITLPGDDVFAAIWIAAKSIHQRGNLIIENAPLEPWNTQTINLARKMGCKPGLQEAKPTSFGDCGAIQIQKFALVGRKVECRPLDQFSLQLGAMIMIGAFAQGQSVFRGLQGLRALPDDGINQIIGCLDALKVRHGDMPDGVVLDGARQYDGFDLTQPLPAHIAGAMAIAGLKAMGNSTINEEQILRRWPGFFTLMDSVCEYRD